MSSPHEIRVALERDYALALGAYETADQAAETIVGLAALTAADKAITARKQVLKEKLGKLDYLLRLQVDPQWTPHHLRPIHPKTGSRRGAIAKAAYRVLKSAKEPMKVREIAHAAADILGVNRTDFRAIDRLDSAIHGTLKKRLAEGAVLTDGGKPTRWSVPDRKWVHPGVRPVCASVPLKRADDLERATSPAASASILPVPRLARG